MIDIYCFYKKKNNSDQPSKIPGNYNPKSFSEDYFRKVSLYFNENFLPHDFLVIDEAEAFKSEAVSTRPYIISEVWRFF